MRVLSEHKEVAEERMGEMPVRNSLVSQVVHHAIHQFFGVNSEWILLRLGRQVLHSENVHVLVLEAQILREDIRERFSRAEDRKVHRRVLRVQ